MAGICCDTSGDLRGMCFGCIRDIRTMTDMMIAKVRECPNTPYAIAYWAKTNNVTDWYKNEYIKLLLHENDVFSIMKMIRNIRCDDDSDEDEYD